MRKILKSVPPCGNIALRTFFSPDRNTLQARITGEFIPTTGKKIELVFAQYDGIFRSQAPYCLEVGNPCLDATRNLELRACWKKAAGQQIKGTLFIKITFHWRDLDPDNEYVLIFHWANIHRHSVAAKDAEKTQLSSSSPSSPSPPSPSPSSPSSSFSSPSSSSSSSFPTLSSSPSPSSSWNPWSSELP